MKYLDLAKKYGLTPEELKSAELSFLENEGFDDNGNEYETLHDWLNRVITRVPKNFFKNVHRDGDYNE